MTPLGHANRALITGGSGFIGRALAQQLNTQGFHVVTLDRNGCGEPPDHMTGSVLNPDDVERALEGVHIVFHLAGLVGTSELLSKTVEAADVNVKGTVNVLEACSRRQVRTVFFPTIPTIWLNTYSITKQAAEGFGRMYARWKGIDVRLLRWLNVYGPGQRAFPVRKAVPTMILQALYGKNIEVWGNGHQPVFLTYVDDLTRNTALYCLRESADSVVRDVGNTVEMTVNDLAVIICRLTNSSSRIVHLPMRAGEDPDIYVRKLHPPTAADLLGLADATTPIEDGLRATIAYFTGLPVREHELALECFARHRDWSVPAPMESESS